VQDRARPITLRVFRDGVEPDVDDWEGSTAEERIEAVGMLTLLCAEWGREAAGGPEFQRSVGRVQRPRG